MRVKVKVTPSSSRRQVIEEAGILRVHLHASPDKGKANKELIEILAEHFGVARSRVSIVRGETSREKIVEISL